MEPFATLDDLQRRWRVLDADQQERAVVLLEDATNLIASEFLIAKKQINLEDEIQAGNLRVVCCSVVKRAMSRDVDGDFTQMSATAGSFTEQYTFANPSGDMYLTQQERRMLGIPKRKLQTGSIPAFDEDRISRARR